MTSKKQSQPTASPPQRASWWTDHPVLTVVAALAAAISLIAFGMALQATIDGDGNEVQAIASPTTEDTQLGSDSSAADPDLADSTSTANEETTTSNAESETTTSSTAATTTTTTTIPTTTSTTTSIELPPPGGLRLTDTADLVRRGPNVKFGTGGVGLIQYEDIVWCKGYVSTDGFAEYRLDRNYARLVGVIGYSDNASSEGSSTIRVENEDGALLLNPVTVSLGDAQIIDIDVSEAIRLTVKCSSTNHYVGLASAYLIPK